MEFCFNCIFPSSCTTKLNIKKITPLLALPSVMSLRVTCLKYILTKLYVEREKTKRCGRSCKTTGAGQRSHSGRGTARILSGFTTSKLKPPCSHNRQITSIHGSLALEQSMSGLSAGGTKQEWPQCVTCHGSLPSPRLQGPFHQYGDTRFSTPVLHVFTLHNESTHTRRQSLSLIRR